MRIVSSEGQLELLAQEKQMTKIEILDGGAMEGSGDDYHGTWLFIIITTVSNSIIY